MIKLKSVVLLLIGVLSALFVMNFFLVIGLINENSGVFTLLSVLIAVFVFFGTLWQDKKKHENKQINFLKSLLSEINVLLGQRSSGDNAMGPHLKWVKERRITDHLVHQINPDFYSQNLDSEIKNKKTNDLVDILRMMKDKIDLVNYYVRKMRDYVYDLWKKEAQNNTKTTYSEWSKDVWKKDKFLKLFNEKLESPVNEAIDLAKKVKCIINERFNVK